MPSEFCPTCGRSLNPESRHPCKCGGPLEVPSRRGVSGKRFVALLAILAVIVALIALGLYFAIAAMRVQHGLSGFHH